MVWERSAEGTRSIPRTSTPKESAHWTIFQSCFVRQRCVLSSSLSRIALRARPHATRKKDALAQSAPTNLGERPSGSVDSIIELDDLNRSHLGLLNNRRFFLIKGFFLGGKGHSGGATRGYEYGVAKSLSRDLRGARRK